MKKRVLVSMVSAFATATCIVTTMHAQEAPAAAPIPVLSFRLVENFFRYPAYSVIGRLSGVAVGPTGNILALNRGYHPVLEFNADGSFVRTWGEGSRRSATVKPAWGRWVAMTPRKAASPSAVEAASSRSSA